MRKATLGLALTIGAAASVVATQLHRVFAQGEPIKFGAVVSATGVGAGLGVNERNGLLLAEKTINAKGGFKGRPIRIIIEDDTSNPDTARHQGQRPDLQPEGHHGVRRLAARPGGRDRRHHR